MTLDEAMAWADTSPRDQRGKPSQASAITLAAEVRRLQAVPSRCSDCSLGHMAECIAQLEAENTALRLYAPARRAQPTVKSKQIGPCDHAYWRLAHETDAEFAEWGNEHTEVEP